MIIGSVSENKDIEKRISITPEYSKKIYFSRFQNPNRKRLWKTFRFYK